MSSIHSISISSSSQSSSELSLPTHNIKYRNHSLNYALQPALDQHQNQKNEDESEIKNISQIIVIDDEDGVQDPQEANICEQELFDVVQIQREEFRSNTNHLKRLMNKAYQNTQQIEQSHISLLKVEQKIDNLERENKNSIAHVQQQQKAEQINQNLILISSGEQVNTNKEADKINQKDDQLINSEQKAEGNQRIEIKQVLSEFIQRSNSQTPKFKYAEQNFFMGAMDKKKNILTDEDLTEEEIEKLQNLTNFKANIFMTKLFLVNIGFLTHLIHYFVSQRNRNQSDSKEIQSIYNERISNETDQDDDVGKKWRLTQTRQNMLNFMYTFLEAFNFNDNGLLKLFIYQCNSPQIEQIYKTILSEIKVSVQKIANPKQMDNQSVQYCLKKILSIPFFQKPKSQKQMGNFLKEFYLSNPVSNKLRQQPEDKNKTKCQSNKPTFYSKNTIFLNQQDKIIQRSHLSKKSSKKQEIKLKQGLKKSQTYKLSQKEKEKNQQQRVQTGKAKQGASSEFPRRRILITLGDYRTYGYGTSENKESRPEEQIEEGEIVELSQPAKKKH